LISFCKSNFWIFHSYKYISFRIYKNTTTTFFSPRRKRKNLSNLSGNPNGEYYKFNIKNPNDLKQVDATKNKEIFSKRNIDGSWKVDKGTTRIDIFTKQAGVLTQEETMEQIKSWSFDILNKQGYWLYSNDFKNIEITNIQNVGSRKKRQAIPIVTRSILHDNKGEEEIKGIS
jgi:hypothetical protein